MGQWKVAGPETMLSDGRTAEVTVDGTKVLLVRIEGRYYAVQALCPHLRARLAIGTLNGFVLRCRAHGSQFDVRDGHNIEWAPKLPKLARKLGQAVAKPTGLRTFATRVEDGQVWVELP